MIYQLYLRSKVAVYIKQQIETHCSVSFVVSLETIIYCALSCASTSAAATAMGNRPPKLSREDLNALLDKTCFTKTQIKQWYKGFMVSNSNSIHLLYVSLTVYSLSIFASMKFLSHIAYAKF